MTLEELIEQIEKATAAEDLEALEKLLSQFVVEGEAQRPFQPAIRLKELDEAAEGDVASKLANSLSRAIRNIKFKRKIAAGYAGPVIVSEGDSWFQYPIILDDVIDCLMDRYAVLSLGAAGDTLAEMVSDGEYIEAIEKAKPDFFLVSASGNDALGGGKLADLLNPYERGTEIPDIIRDDKLQEALQRIDNGYTKIITTVREIDPKIRVLFHGYDKPVPRRDGRWLGKPMSERGIPQSMQPEVTGFLIERLNDKLETMESRYPGVAVHVKCIGCVGGARQSWYDELHPRNPGYRRIADQFEAQIEDLNGRAPARAPATPLAPVVDHEKSTPTEDVWALIEENDEFVAAEAIISSREPLREPRALTALDREMIEDYRELERERFAPDQDKRLRARRHMVPTDDDEAFERILGESNLFPVNFLSRGAVKSQAVAKIQLFTAGGIPHGSGSGFLVAPGLMLTNNHVIGSREAARQARAIFDFQLDNRFMHMPTKTFEINDDVFFTSDRHALDFTFVSVATENETGAELSDYGHFEMIEESGKAVKNEPVSIIQHPLGDLKSIALRDSKILGVKGNFIYYTTDTEPGASGSPVLNDQWLPVALHHRSVPHPTIPNKWIANRGIRISRIFATLRDAAQRNDRDAIRILELIGATSTQPLAQSPGDGRGLRRREVDFVPSIDAPIFDSDLPATEEADFPAGRWDGIDGYDPDFLSKTISLPLPSNNEGVNEINGRPDLPYMHFSVVMHSDRKLPMVTACNVDGAQLRRLRRRGDWRFDPRLPRSEQVGNDAYRRNDYDRGHMVRRVAPMWGSNEEARFAEADTFHYTVSAPQHKLLNQKAWLELEDYLLDWADQNSAKLSIFTGPLFRSDDPLYRGVVRVPADYWKVAIAETSSGFRAAGYLHTQKNLIPTVDEAFGDYRTHRVPVHILAELSGLSFDAVVGDDVSGDAFETVGFAKVVEGPEDIGFW